MRSERVPWRALERWSASIFLVAGGLLLGSTCLKGVEWFTSVTVPAVLVALLALPGLVASVLGLLGLFPRLVGRSPRLAAVGAVLTASTGGAIVAVVGWVIVARLLLAAGVARLATPPEYVFVLLVAMLALGFALFGGVSVYSKTPSREAGALLVGFAATWLAILAVGVAYGPAAPNWLYFVVYGAQPVALLSIGYVLRSSPAEQELLSSDPTSG